MRVDILERLADLIRPALAWRAGASGAKPAGAVDGGGFIVTGAMTSLTGASGEDFASILRSLGYRMEQRPKPPEPDRVPPAAAEAAPRCEAAAEPRRPMPPRPNAAADVGGRSRRACADAAPDAEPDRSRELPAAGNACRPASAAGRRKPAPSRRGVRAVHAERGTAEAAARSSSAPMPRRRLRPSPR